MQGSTRRATTEGGGGIYEEGQNTGVEKRQNQIQSPANFPLGKPLRWMDVSGPRGGKVLQAKNKARISDALKLPSLVLGNTQKKIKRESVGRGKKGIFTLGGKAFTKIAKQAAWGTSNVEGGTVFPRGKNYQSREKRY